SAFARDGSAVRLPADPAPARALSAARPHPPAPEGQDAGDAAGVAASGGGAAADAAHHRGPPLARSFLGGVPRGPGRSGRAVAPARRAPPSPGLSSPVGPRRPRDADSVDPSAARARGPHDPGRGGSEAAAGRGPRPTARPDRRRAPVHRGI